MRRSLLWPLILGIAASSLAQPVIAQAKAAVGAQQRVFDPLSRLPVEVRHFLDNLPTAPAGKKLIAVIDHDKTLVQGDVGEQFMKWMTRKGYFPDTARLKAAQRANKQGQMDDLDLFKLAVTGMAGLKESRVAALAKRYYALGFGGFASKIFAPQKALIAELTRRGVEVHIVSGSNPWIVRESARHLGVPVQNVHAMGVVVENGRLTDKLVDPVPWREGKVNAIDAAKLRERGVIVFAAGDSSGDLKMLELPKGHGISMTVNDHDAPQVAKVAQENGYARATFTSVDTLGGGK
jgi:HAD superfamily phosphoserine phosphatase-like hydrolase